MHFGNGDKLNTLTNRFRQTGVLAANDCCQLTETVNRWRGLRWTSRRCWELTTLSWISSCDRTDSRRRNCQRHRSTVGKSSPCHSRPQMFVLGYCSSAVAAPTIWSTLSLDICDIPVDVSLIASSELWMGKGKLWPLTDPKPLNGSLPNLNHVITSWTPITKNLGSICSGGSSPHICEIYALKRSNV